MNNIQYDYIIIGSGIAGCSMAYFLYEKNNQAKILLCDKNQDISQEGTNAAGAYLSPLIGKDNPLKSLVNQALIFSINLYKNIAKDILITKGIVKYPINNSVENINKFLDICSYDKSKFDINISDEKVLYKIGSKIDPYKICTILSSNIKKKLDYDIENIEYDNNQWILNNSLKTKKLILCTSINMNLINEDYINQRSLWGMKLDFTTSTKIDYNHHKKYTISSTSKSSIKNIYNTSIGSTYTKLNLNELYKNNLQSIDKEKLIKQIPNIINLKNIKIKSHKIGVRACSIDYFPIIGEVINSIKTLTKYPHIKNGTKVSPKDLQYHQNLFIFTGLGSRGFVLAPYLAKKLVDNIYDNISLDDKITPYRLFIKYIRKIKPLKTIK